MAAPIIINPTDFDKYSKAWAKLVTPPGVNITPYFSNGAGTLITCASFQLSSIISLVSAVGGDQIKVRFLIDNTNHFNLAMYVTDASNNHLSAYYQAEIPWTNATSSSSLNLSPGNSNATVTVPTILANTWLSNWAATTVVTTNMFVSNSKGGGPLLGYNFNLRDFVNSLSYAQAFKDPASAIIGVDYALHQSYLVNDTVSPSNTFGLVVATYDGAPVTPDAGGSLFFYDLSMPCPPGT